jgi:hypothetical protein
MVLARTSLVLAGLLALAAPAQAGQGQSPVVAVFDLEAKGVELPAEALDRLTDFLATRLAAGGAFRVVPRAQVRERLFQAQLDSYRACYDAACQIEIGRELAASHSLAGALLRLGQGCTLTATLFDLKAAAAERAASAPCGCDEAEVARAIERVTVELGAASPGQARPEAPPPAEPPSTAAEPGPAPTDPEPLELRRRDRLEWLGVRLQTGGSAHPYYAFGGVFEGVTWRTPHLHWTALELGAGLTDSDHSYFLVGTRLAYPVHLTADGEHLIRIGLGLGFWQNEYQDSNQASVRTRGGYLSLFVRYQWQLIDSLALGLEVSALLLLAEWSGARNPWAAFVGIPIVWTQAAEQ